MFRKLGVLLVGMMLVGIWGFQKVVAKCNCEEKGVVKQNDKVALINAMTPYVTVNPDYSLTVDKTKARRVGVSKKAIELATEIVKLNNEVVANPDLFMKPIAPSQLKKVESAFAQLNEIACGGGPNKPHPCPKWATVSPIWKSKQAVINYLVSVGYHKTADYASNYNADDYTRCVNAYGCSGCKFRTQAIITGQNNKWGYKYQTPEPNPEILSYIWPAYWWGTYVRWWHLNYC